jgi:hypothetical protein
LQTSRTVRDRQIHGGRGPAYKTFEKDTVGHTGYIDWHRLARTKPWTDTGEGHSFVFAFWLADYGHTNHDHGLGLLKGEGSHPDWFLYAETADRMLFSVGVDDLIVSPNITEVYDTHMTSRPLIASILLGTAKATYAAPDRTAYWWCSVRDLTRPGKRLVKEISMLYLRPPVIITFLEMNKPMKQVVPGTTGDTATVNGVPGQQPSE